MAKTVGINFIQTLKTNGKSAATRQTPEKKSLSERVLSETMQDRRQWDDLFIVLEKKNVNQESYIWQNIL